MEQLPAAAISTRNLIGEPDTTIQDMEKWLQESSEQGAELALFPELNVTGYIPNAIAGDIAEHVPGPSTDKIIRLAGHYAMTIALGLIERDMDKLYCTHVIVNGGGIVGKQRKVHAPIQERPYWYAGDSIDVFDIGKAKIGIAICRDAFFDEMTRTFYFKGAEVVLMPFGYYNVPRNQYLQETIHGKSLLKSAWTNDYYELVCNRACDRPAGLLEPNGRKFPGWVGIIDPWGSVLGFIGDPGNNETMVIRQLEPAQLHDRRDHPNFLAKELRVDLYKWD